MNVNILAVGDVVGQCGLSFLRERLRALKRERHIDFTVVNGENANVVGVTPDQADAILAAGAGLWLFLKNSYPDYLFYRVPFAFIDYDKAVPVVLLEALLIAFFWVFTGTQLPKLLNRKADPNSKLISLIGVLSIREPL